MKESCGLARVHGSLPDQKAAELVTKRLEEYDIALFTVVCFTTDAAPVMSKFMRSLPTAGILHQLCYTHGIHLVVCDVLYKKKPQNQLEIDVDFDLGNFII